MSMGVADMYSKPLLFTYPLPILGSFESSIDSIISIAAAAHYSICKLNG